MEWRSCVRITPVRLNGPRGVDDDAEGVRNEYGKLRRKARRGNRRQGLRPEEGCHGVHGRHRRGVVRVFPLRLGRHPGLRQGVLPQCRTELDGIIAAFLTYAVGFIARPIGGIVFGHFGDKFGRKKLLQLSIILVGVSTFLMGCLPTFAADRLLGPGPAGLPALRPGLRRRRRMGRRRPPRRRAQPQQVPRLLGQLAAVRRSDGQPARHRRAVHPVLRAVLRGLPRLGLARGVLALRRDRPRSATTSAPRSATPRSSWRPARRSRPATRATASPRSSAATRAASSPPWACASPRTSSTTSWSPSPSPT